MEVNVHDLKFWIQKVINDPELLPRAWTLPDGTVMTETFCNIFVQRVCRGLKYDAFDGMTANQIFDFCKETWTEIPLAHALEAALVGDIVLAAVKQEPHGHVAIVWPEMPLVYSGKWKMEVPRVASVGKENAIMGMNYAFKDVPHIFRLGRVLL